MSDHSTTAVASTWERVRSGTASALPRLIRETVIDATRHFFKRRGFHEVETPLFVRYPGMEPHLDAFATTWRTTRGVEHRGYLTTSPEYAMKKLLAAGIAPIFQICKSFRNGEEASARHNPEFTMLEWYRANADYRDLMRDCEELIREIAVAVRASGLTPDSLEQRTNSRPGYDPHPNPLPEGEGKSPPLPAGGDVIPPLSAGRGRPRAGEGLSALASANGGRGDAESARTTWTYQGETIDLTAPWERLTVRAAFARYADVDVFANADAFFDVARAKGYAIGADTTWEQAFHQIFLNEIEPLLGLGRPTFLYDYPLSMAALSRPRPDDPAVAERFELYIAGVELANAFSELTDASVQLQRLRQEQSERRALGKTVYDIDGEFMRALERGLPPSAGIALGVDRLAMLFADVNSIGEVLWFPADELFET